MCVVFLDRNEIAMAMWDAQTRYVQITALRYGPSSKKDPGGLLRELENDLIGSMAEIATAKLLGVFWSSANATWKRPDVHGFHVRASTHDTARLVIRQDDPPGPYVLCIVQPPTVRIVGVCSRQRVKDEWIDNPNGKGQAWFVPQSELAPFDLDKAKRWAA